MLKLKLGVKGELVIPKKIRDSLGFKDNVILDGQILSTLDLINVTATDAATYKCLATGYCGFEVSNNAPITISGLLFSKKFDVEDVLKRKKSSLEQELDDHHSKSSSATN